MKKSKKTGKIKAKSLKERQVERDAKYRAKKARRAKGRAPGKFEDLVTGVAMKRLTQAVDYKVAVATHHSQKRLAEQLLETISPVQVGYMTIKAMLMEKIDFTEENWKFQETEVLDRSLGYEKVEDVAKKGDYIRLLVRQKGDGDDEEYGDEELIELPNLMDDQTTSTSTIPEIEEGVLGMKAGETRELLEAGDDTAKPPTKTYFYKVTMYKVSRKPEVPKKEVEDGEGDKNTSSE